MLGAEEFGVDIVGFEADHKIFIVTVLLYYIESRGG